MDIAGYLYLVFSITLANNFVLAKFLGLCPFLGVSKKRGDAMGMGAAVIFVMTLSSFATWALTVYVLMPLGLEYLKTIVYILVIAVLVQFVEMVIKKYAVALYEAMGIYLPLITTNCAVLGVTMLNLDNFILKGHPPMQSLIECLLQGFGGGLGFSVALYLMSGIRERLEFARIPKPLQGIPIAFIMACLMALAFLGFSGF